MLRCRKLRDHASAAALSMTKTSCCLGPNKSTMFVAWDEVKSRLVLTCRVSLETQVDAAAVFPSTQELLNCDVTVFSVYTRVAV